MWLFLYNKISMVDGFSFFFSCRRRHTRFSRDWSSDVCSSDLPLGRGARILRAAVQCSLVAVRRVVTGIGTDGRSMIVSDADAPGGDPMAGLWRTDPAPGPEGYDGEVGRAS